MEENAPFAPIEDQPVKDFETEELPKFEIFKDKAGEFRFRLKAANGEIIASGEGYTTRKACLNGIASIGKNAPEAAVFEVE